MFLKHAISGESQSNGAKPLLCFITYKCINVFFYNFIEAVMKKLFFVLALIIIFNANHAQSCGNSGPAIGSPAGNDTVGKLTPVYTSLPPVINDSITELRIEFKNIDTIDFAGSVLTLHALKVDSILNLPQGLCWATNKTDNTFGPSEDALIKISGTPCDTPGQYKLNFWLLANFGNGWVAWDIDVDTGPDYSLRLANPGQQVPAVDTSQSAAHPFISYNVLPACTQALSINDMEVVDAIRITVFPNPFTTETQITIPEVQKFDFELYDMTGRVVKRMPNMQTNQFYLNRNGLPGGSYLYKITTTGRHVLYGRVVIH